MPGHKIWPAGHGLCNLFFLSRVPSGTRRYIFLFSSTSALPRRWRQGCCSCVTPGAARTFDAQLADLRLLMILTLGFQTILPAQIALMSARGVNTPLGWYIVIAQMAGVLLAFMLVGGLVAALRSLLGEERCRAARGYGALQRHCHTVRDGISPLSHGVCLSANLCRPALAFATPFVPRTGSRKKQRGCRRCQIMRFCLKSRRKLPSAFIERRDMGNHKMADALLAFHHRQISIGSSPGKVSVATLPVVWIMASISPSASIPINKLAARRRAL